VGSPVGLALGACGVVASTEHDRRLLEERACARPVVANIIIVSMSPVARKHAPTTQRGDLV